MNSLLLGTSLVFASLPSLGLSRVGKCSLVARIHWQASQMLIVSTWVTSQYWPPVSSHHAWPAFWNILYFIWDHWYFLSVWPMLEVTYMISLLSLPIPSNSCSFIFIVPFILQSYWSASVPRKLHDLSPFLAFAYAILPAWNTFITSLPILCCSTPLFGQLIPIFKVSSQMSLYSGSFLQHFSPLKA